MRNLFGLSVCLALAACGSGDSEPGGITASEAQALDDAAEMLEQRRLPEEALRKSEPDKADLPPES